MMTLTKFLEKKIFNLVKTFVVVNIVRLHLFVRNVGMTDHVRSFIFQKPTVKSSPKLRSKKRFLELKGWRE